MPVYETNRCAGCEGKGNQSPEGCEFCGKVYLDSETAIYNLRFHGSDTRQMVYFVLASRFIAPCDFFREE